MTRTIPTEQGGSTQSIQTIIVDGCKVTLRFAKKFNQTALKEIREILASPVAAKQPDFLQK